MKNSKSAIFFITVLGLVAAGCVVGMVQPLFIGDSTYLTYGIVGIAVFLTFSASLRDWCCEHGITLLLGLLGTVIGFSMALQGVEASDQVMKMNGVQTALNTTIVGLTSHLYLIIQQRINR